MTELVLTTFDWVPEQARGHVRDLRIRWALEEGGLPYRIQSLPFHHRSATHIEHQPFCQVPWLTDGNISIFESGAILLYLGERSEALLPTEPRRRIAAVQWMFAALNSMETAIFPWLVLSFTSDGGDSPGAKRAVEHRDARLRHIEPVLRAREWLAGSFSVADILMADALRLFDGTEVLSDFSACRDYVDRATSRPPFRKAHGDQLAHFARAESRPPQ